VNQQGADAPRRKQSPFLWALLVLSAVTIATGVYLLVVQRQKIAAESQPAATGPTQARATDFQLTSADGAQIRLSDLRGKVVLLNFWATWCPPCKAEMPDLNALYRDYGAEHDFVVVGVDVEENGTDVRDFVGRQRIGFPLLLDEDGHVSDSLYAVRSLPTSMIIDRQGYIRDAWIGQIAKEAMLARLKKVW